MYYLIDNDANRRYDDISDVLDECVTVDYYEDDGTDFDEYLDDGQRIEICGYEFNPSEVLREMDSNAYYNERRYWAENRVEQEKDDYRYELERASDGDRIWVCGCQIYCYDDEDEEEYDDTDVDDDLFFERLEKKILEQKAAEDQIAEEEKTTADDFLSVLGIQII